MRPYDGIHDRRRLVFLRRPDTIYKKIKTFYDPVGGLDVLLLLNRQGLGKPRLTRTFPPSIHLRSRPASSELEARQEYRKLVVRQPWVLCHCSTRAQKHRSLDFLCRFPPHAVKASHGRNSSQRLAERIASERRRRHQKHVGVVFEPKMSARFQAECFATLNSCDLGWDRAILKRLRNALFALGTVVKMDFHENRMLPATVVTMNKDLVCRHRLVFITAAR